MPCLYAHGLGNTDEIASAFLCQQQQRKKRETHTHKKHDKIKQNEKKTTEAEAAT